jgi:hypothetical protein
MKIKKYLPALAAAAVLLFVTGCFRVGSETRALRDAALEVVEADEKIELGVGFFTVRLARFGSQFLELPPEAKLVMDAVSGAECSVYELHDAAPDTGKILARADKSMDKRGYDRVVGVAHNEGLVAVYVPRSMKTHRTMDVSVLVLDHRQLVCVKARGDLEPLMKVALAQVQQHLPAKTRVAAAL